MAMKLFSSKTYMDPQLGELRRRWGAWRGQLVLGDGPPVPLVLYGTRTAPDGESLQIARTLTAQYTDWRPTIERALLEHYAAYAEAVRDGELAEDEQDVPAISSPAEVWRHVTTEFVQVSPLDGQLVVEFGYRVAWDEEHTLGVRFRDGQLLEMCGSVLAP